MRCVFNHKKKASERGGDACYRSTRTTRHWFPPAGGKSDTARRDESRSLVPSANSPQVCAGALAGSRPLSDARGPVFDRRVWFRPQAARTFCRLGGSLLLSVARTLAVKCHCGSEEPVDATRRSDCADTYRPLRGAQAESMYGASGIPDLIPPGGPPRQPGPAGQYNPGHPQIDGQGRGENPQRLGQRAPKLGQIGRSKKGECFVCVIAKRMLLFDSSCT